MSESYRTAERGFVRHEVEDRTLYRVTQNTTTAGTNDWLTAGMFGAEFSLSSQLSLGNYSVNGTVQRDGLTFVELTADEPAPNMDVVPAYDGTALVTPDGVVHSVAASYEWGTGDDREFREGSVSLDTDVEWTGEPPWVDDLPHLSVSIVEDGRALELRNTGGAALSANTTFEVYGMDSIEGWEARVYPDVNGTVTTDATLEPGEAVYVTADENGSSFTLHDDSVRGEYTFVAAKLHSREENTIYSLVTGLEQYRAA